MVLTLFNIFYVLIAIAMCILILLQSGSGAQAGSGFGGGASATVFGARGASTFLSRSTAVLAGLFFVLSLAMGIYLHPTATASQSDLGVMSGVATPAAEKAPAAGSDVPVAPSAPGAAPGAAAPATQPAAPAKPVPAPVKPDAKADGAKAGSAKSDKSGPSKH